MATFSKHAVGALVALAGCRDLSATEVGVRTCLFGIFEAEGTQETLGPGGTHLIVPLVNSWQTLPIHQQNLLMNADPKSGDRPVADHITSKTKDGNNVQIDVNVLWRVDPKKAAWILANEGSSLDEIKERVLRPYSRAIIRDAFNDISSEEYYQVSLKNRKGELARERLSRELEPMGIVIDGLQIQGHRFGKEYQAAIDAQKQAEAAVQTLVEQEKAMVAAKASELVAKRAGWNQAIEDARGDAGRLRNEADAYYERRTREARAELFRARAEAEGLRREAAALSQAGGDAYVKIKIAEKLAKKRFLLVPNANITTANINELVRSMNEKSSSSKSP